MPPRKRAAVQPDPDSVPETGTPLPETPEPEDPEICAECFPSGWAAGSTACGCVHGSWLREAGD